MKLEALPWLILFLPLLSAATITLFTQKNRELSARLSIGAIVSGFVLSVLFISANGWEPLRKETMATWLEVGDLQVDLGLRLDPLSLLMLLVVTGVGGAIHIYSRGYMRDDPGFSRYFAGLSLFTFSMLGIVLANNFLMLFIFWELVGVSSYLLIGHWFERPSAADAAKKAFITNRLGDFGFLLGILMVWELAGGLNFSLVQDQLKQNPALFGTMATIVGLLIFCGAVGKSAQFPLHVWLPDAMEGPTPVSALIHAATMVTAGVYMVARAYPLFALVPSVLTLIAWVGAFTALLAATMACVERDIKRVLAYSTVSQLGYMMAANGAGAPEAAFQHLTTHGVFKALLFLGAGIVIHHFHTNDVFRMGGLFGQRPWVGGSFLVATLALAGVWPLPGFFSKEAVLAGVLHAHLSVPFLMLLATSFLTAFYMFRVVFLAFFGHAPVHHAHPEPPVAMDAVCRALAVLTLALGLRAAVASHHVEGPAWLPWISLTWAFAGIALAWATYQAGRLDPARLAAAFAPIDFLARRRYFLDDVYGGTYRLLLLGLSRVVGWFDRYVVDGVLNALSAGALRAGDALRRIQNGQPQDYVYGIALAVLLMLVWAQLG